MFFLYFYTDGYHIRCVDWGYIRLKFDKLTAAEVASVIRIIPDLSNNQPLPVCNLNDVYISVKCQSKCKVFCLLLFQFIYYPYKHTFITVEISGKPIENEGDTDAVNTDPQIWGHFTRDFYLTNRESTVMWSLHLSKLIILSTGSCWKQSKCDIFSTDRLLPTRYWVSFVRSVGKMLYLPLTYLPWSGTSVVK